MEEKKNKGGRPTKYTPELVEKARDYIDNYEQYDHAFPSDVGLANILDISRVTLYDWEKHDDKQEFSNILEKINGKQQLVAWRKGLVGDYNASLVKLLLGKHGYSDKVESDNKSSDGSMKPQSITIEHVTVKGKE